MHADFAVQEVLHPVPQVVSHELDEHWNVTLLGGGPASPASTPLPRTQSPPVHVHVLPVHAHPVPVHVAAPFVSGTEPASMIVMPESFEGVVASAPESALAVGLLLFTRHVPLVQQNADTSLSCHQNNTDSEET